ncbi:uncharacterized protein F5147DRAFT_693788 [Suillus discolor]|uniref:Uncharacterized protein n=1 Tax=Suillus discolor TaxID=1912936 RepID=A0A9P7F748_9AGAM|nr:uncharacterized protein F5147DRAFT_693788 [Suillus discolor]KAG2109042.1 hypothetical protein F5147DRAFT_693788 [Suillus discolor]
MALTTPKAELIGVFMESLAYGVYLMVFSQCMSVLRNRQSRPSDYLVGTAISLFIFITAHVAVDILRNIQAFTTDEAEPNYPTIYYGTFDTWQNILKTVLYVAVTLVSDAFILYRSFIVWGRSYLISTFPFLLFIADIAMGVLLVYTLSRVVPGENVFADALSVRVKIFYSNTLAMNVVCTSLIAFKILNIQKAITPFAKSGGDQVSRLVPIIVESASVYSILLMVMIGTCASGSPAMFIVLNSISPIIGIVFSSVIVRVGLGVSHGDSHRANGTVSSARNVQWMTRVGSRLPNSEPPIYAAPFPYGGVQVSLQQTVHTHADTLPDDIENGISSSHTKGSFSALSV